MSFEEQDRVTGQVHGRGWRPVATPQGVVCYVASTWMELPVGDVNDQTREIRVNYTTVEHGTRKLILDASLYRPTEGLFAAAHRAAGPAAPSPE